MFRSPRSPGAVNQRFLFQLIGEEWNPFESRPGAAIHHHMEFHRRSVFLGDRFEALEDVGIGEGRPGWQAGVIRRDRARSLAADCRGRIAGPSDEQHGQHDQRGESPAEPESDVGEARNAEGDAGQQEDETRGRDPAHHPQRSREPPHLLVEGQRRVPLVYTAGRRNHADVRRDGIRIRLGHSSSSNRSGASTHSLMVLRKVTASVPSMIRWS